MEPLHAMFGHLKGYNMPNNIPGKLHYIVVKCFVEKLTCRQLLRCWSLRAMLVVLRLNPVGILWLD